MDYPVSAVGIRSSVPVVQSDRYVEIVARRTSLSTDRFRDQHLSQLFAMVVYGDNRRTETSRRRRQNQLGTREDT